VSADHRELRRKRVQQRTTFARAWLTTAIGTLSALAMSLPSQAARRRVIRLARELGYDHRPPAPTLPRLEVESVLRDVRVSVRSPVAADGNVTLLELIVLNNLVAARRPRRLFEIGTYDGRTTVNLAANAPAEAVVYTLDLPAGTSPMLAVHDDDLPFIERSRQTRGERFRGSPEAGKIRQLEGDSATLDYSQYAGSIDFIFVDGSHSFDYVHSDSQAAIQMAAPGALIAWHDYGVWPDVTRALNELPVLDARFNGMRHVNGTALAILEI
jgi:predicted O-methyltransferase YrrM